MKAPRASAVSPHEECDGADSVERFAAKNAISRAQAYKEIAIGRLTARKVGSRTIVTREDAAKWRRALPKMSVRDASNTREPGNGLPTWMRGSQNEHLRSDRPSPRKGQTKTQGDLK